MSSRCSYCTGASAPITGVHYEVTADRAALGDLQAQHAAIIRDRRVEITGPVDRKMIINALNSGANVFMADFEDSNSPTWRNNLEGQANLRDAVEGTISYVSPEGKRYELNPPVATLLVRPRGWHLEEKHFQVDGKAISGSLFDFGLYFFHNAAELLRRGSGPYFYLPKLQSMEEATLWDGVLAHVARDGARDEVIREVVRGSERASGPVTTIAMMSG